MSTAVTWESDEKVPVVLDGRVCLAVQRPDSPCRRCADDCAAQAISVSARQVEISADTCTSCGRCVAACPTGALSSAHCAVTARAYECQRVPGRVRVAGSQAVPCLGGLDEETLRCATLQGEVSLIDRGWCADCPVAGHAAPWASAVARVAQEGEALGKSMRALIVRAPLDPAQALAPPSSRTLASKGLSRRQLFFRLARPETAEHAEAPDSLALLPGQIAPPRLATRLMTLRAAAGPGPLDAGLFPDVTLPASVDLRLVAGICPTAAISLHEMSRADVVVFDAARCLGSLGCTACQDAGAVIRSSGEGVYHGPVALIERPMADCPKCDSRFAPRNGQRVCDACNKDYELTAFAHGLMRRAPVNRGP